MHKVCDHQGQIESSGYERIMSILIWIAVLTGWIVAIFTVIQEMCMVSACRDTAGFTVFGFNMGWFGIAYFSLILIVLWLRRKDYRFDEVCSVLIFSGVGAEFRLLWIQKYVIGGWCPLCVTICSALFAVALFLVIKKIWAVRTGVVSGKCFWGWGAVMLLVSVIGLVIAVVGVKAVVY